MLRNEYLSLLEIELSRKGNNGNLVFTCNGCQQIGDYVAAIVAVEDEENDKYHVVELHSQPITSVGYPETKQISRRPRVRCATWCWKIPPEVFRSEYIRNRTKPVFRKEDFPGRTEDSLVLH